MANVNGAVRDVVFFGVTSGFTAFPTSYRDVMMRYYITSADRFLFVERLAGGVCVTFVDYRFLSVIGRSNSNFGVSLILDDVLPIDTVALWNFFVEVFNGLEKNGLLFARSSTLSGSSGMFTHKLEDMAKLGDDIFFGMRETIIAAFLRHVGKFLLIYNGEKISLSIPQKPSPRGTGVLDVVRQFYETGSILFVGGEAHRAKDTDTAADIQGLQANIRNIETMLGKRLDEQKARLEVVETQLQEKGSEIRRISSSFEVVLKHLSSQDLVEDREPDGSSWVGRVFKYFEVYGLSVIFGIAVVLGIYVMWIKT